MASSGEFSILARAAGPQRDGTQGIATVEFWNGRSVVKTLPACAVYFPEKDKFYIKHELNLLTLESSRYYVMGPWFKEVRPKETFNNIRVIFHRFRKPSKPKKLNYVPELFQRFANSNFFIIPCKHNRIRSSFPDFLKEWSSPVVLLITPSHIYNQVAAGNFVGFNKVESEYARSRDYANLFKYTDFNISENAGQYTVEITPDKPLWDCGLILIPGDKLDHYKVIGCYKKGQFVNQISFLHSKEEHTTAIISSTNTTDSNGREEENQQNHQEEHTTAIISSTNTTDSNGREEENQENDQVPAEVKARGPKALDAYRKALKYGEVEVHRERIILVGQARAGKTSLKNFLLGLSFNPAEQSTEGQEVDYCRVDVDDVKNWQRTDPTNIVSNSADCLARMTANELKKDEEHEDQTRGPSVSGDDIARVTTYDLKKDEEHEGERQVEKRDDISENDGVTPHVQQQVKEESYDSIKDDGHIENEGVHQPENPIDKPGETVPSEPEDISEDVTDKLVHYLQSTLNLDDSSTKPETIRSVWDFAGQHLYYASHAVFLSPRAVYLLVYNLSKDLNAEAELCVRQGVFEERLENADGHTNLEAILSWLVSIHNIRPEDDVPAGPTRQRVDRTRERPRVIMVGTNADRPFQDPKKMETVKNIESSSNKNKNIKEVETVIKNSLTTKTYKYHVVNYTQFFAVDNTRQFSDKGIQSLQDKINEVFDMERKDKIPVRWLNFEKVIQALVTEEETKYMSIEKLEKIIQKVCYIDERDDISAMLDFYHDLGVIVKHGDTVVLETQWLIDLFKKVITIQHNPGLEFQNCWIDLQERGVLSMKLVEHVFSELLVSGQSKKDLLDMMEDYGLIAAHKVSDTGEVRYFVPAQLTSSPEKLLNIQPSPIGPCALCIHFVDGFVPHGLYTLLVSKCIAWCSTESPQSREPNLYRNASRYFLGTSSEYQLVLICYQHYIKVILSSSKANKSCFYEPVAVSIRNFIETTLKEISEECRCYRSLKYQLSILCPSCSQPEHEVVACCNHDCVHLLNLEKMTFDVTEFPHHKMVCNRNFDEEAWPEVQGQQYWYSKQEQKTVPSLEETSSQPEGSIQAGSSNMEEVTFTLQPSSFVQTTNFNLISPIYRPDLLESVYKMTSSPRGLAVIVNIKKFEPVPDKVEKGEKLEEREGSELDVHDFRRLFDGLDFQIETLFDNTEKELMEELSCISKRDFSQFDCFVMCIMSHGKEDFFYCYDGGKVKVSKIRNMFNNVHCGTLCRKPKLFFIQACRGESKDFGRLVSDAPLELSVNENENAESETDRPTSGFKKLRAPKGPSTSENADILMAYSSVEGYTSYRNTETGSRFIRSIVDKFREYAAVEDVMSMLTRVINQVNRDGDIGTKQVPKPETTLTKKVFFWPGVRFHSEHN